MADPVRFVHADSLSAFEFSPSHPFKPLRSELTRSLLEHAGALSPEDIVAPGHLSESELAWVHDSDYIELVKAVSAGQSRRTAFAAGLGTNDNPIFPGMHAAVLGICAATVSAVDLVASGKAKRAFNPSGGLHHAHADRASGFCIYNDLAVGIEHAVRVYGMRVAYIDLDAHHGDGVQNLFYERPEVMTISVHESGRYLFPGTGQTYEVGRGAGNGLSVNAPLEPFTEDESFLEVIDGVLPDALAWFRPDLIVLQAGADAHRHDPLADLSLSLQGLTRAFRHVVELSNRHCGGRMVATGGGGYDAWRTVPRAWAHLWCLMSGRELPELLPESWRAKWAEEGIPDLPESSLDLPSDFDPQPRRSLVTGQNQAMLRRLAGAHAPLASANGRR